MTDIEFRLFPENSQTVFDIIALLLVAFLSITEFGIAVFPIVILFVAIHEFGHASMLYLFNIPCIRIQIAPLGGFVEHPSVDMSPIKDLAIAISGVVSSVIGLFIIAFIISDYQTTTQYTQIIIFVFIYQYANLAPIKSIGDGFTAYTSIVQYIGISNRGSQLGTYAVVWVIYISVGIVLLYAFNLLLT